MTAFWPTPAWLPWADLAAAGIRATDDPRSVSPPCVLFEIESAAIDGACNVGTVVRATAISPGAAHADARLWLWTAVVPLLLPYADAEGANESEYADKPAAVLRLPAHYQIETRS